jgi:hypothetical protein
LAGDRDVFHAVTNAAPQAGKFTLVLPGPANDDGSPSGHSYGAVTISKAGDARLIGSLADGTPFAQSAPLAKDGHWPFYTPLYAARGSVLGWLGVTNRTEPGLDDITGLVSWIRPALPAARQYVSGFAHEAQAVGSAYVTPPGVTNRVLELTEGVAEFSGGPLENPLTCALALAANNRVTALDSNKLALTFVKPSGLFSGSVRNPETGRAMVFRGAVLQNRTAGLGYFPGTLENGRVEIAPR